MRYYSNTAVETELALLLDSVAGQMTVVSSAGHPAAPFTVIISPDGALEEIVLVTRKVGLTYDITRAWGGTPAVEHPVGSRVRHGAVAEDFREASLAYQLLYGVPVYSSTDPAALPLNSPLIPVTDYVRKSQATWGDLLASS
jgi:hypothetical protein